MMAVPDALACQAALAAAFDDPELQCYAIVDCAQDNALLPRLTSGEQALGMRSACLLAGMDDVCLQPLHPPQLRTLLLVWLPPLSTLSSISDGRPAKSPPTPPQLPTLPI